VVGVYSLPEQTLVHEPGALGALEGLLQLARAAGHEPLPRVLEAAGEAIAKSAGFRVVSMNIYRQEYDDYSTTLVHGRPEFSDPRLRQPPLPCDFISRLPGTPVQRAPGIYFIAGTPGMWDGCPHFSASRTPEADGTDAWRNEDVLLMLLQDVDGEPLGVLSVDEPISGMRPTDGELRLLGVICLYVEQALRTAKRARQTEEDKRMLARLSEVSPRMSECRDRRELYRLVATTITADLGFDRAAVYVRSSAEHTRRVHVLGWESRDLLPETLPTPLITALVAAEIDHGGTCLVPARDLFRQWVGRRSERNGSGPLAWNDHSLLVPWFDANGLLAGLVVAEDPVDRLLPRQERRRSVRRLVDLSASIEHTITQSARLNRLASLDTLTGLRNRRGLHKLIDENRDCALMVCDLDDFKQINDRYGHETGDLVLARFAKILREHIREADIAVRLGGDEFCVILSGTDAEGATLVSERIRTATPVRMQGLVPTTVTVSVGLAHRDDDTPSPRSLLTAADRALYGAKRDGRNRTVIAGRSIA
jgi:diguanylate cyclase (GGDEF)-like protein